ncbi:hemagglutinin/amebocyte aggregation factor-like [Mercenaria mercenaria]|uniref:hemagglutinin/amebocyte aggregation factor-like n=1 Tax=Mercenaria mercenaria TaxID=6596 RepID=UPI00234E3BC8|nr:hemagglutinin/amebocyte aggregation factor-like [Mercenaria mercenaria]
MAYTKAIRLVLLLAVVLFQTLGTDGNYINDMDGRLHFNCPMANQSISQIQSYHVNRYEDRRFRMNCRTLPGNVQYFSTKCYNTGYLNEMDKVLDFNCGRNGYINGVQSYHSDHYEDRRWKVRCCEVPGMFLVNCSTTSWTNDWDGYQSFTLPTGQVLSGAYSYHKDYYEDRRWKYRTCNVRDGIFD